MADKAKGVNWHVLTIVLIALGTFLVGTNRIPVPTVDGAIRASMAREIVTTGQLWPVTYQGEIFIDHPPLYVWLTAASYKVFGVNDFAANFVPRLFAFLTVILTGLIALKAGYGTGVALLSVLVLVLTRDFVLSSVRGYIEPLLEFFFYGGLWFVFQQQKSRGPWPAFLAGAMVWLGAYSKGPVALWPLVFLGLAFAWSGKSWKHGLGFVAAYVGGLATCTLIWAGWTDANNTWIYWQRYLHEQVLSSAVEGRGGAQTYEPFYFFDILLKHYWPWLPLLLWSIIRLLREFFRRRGGVDEPFTRAVAYPGLLFFFGLGFVAGFSLVRWKFWYYIAPAYPAFALFIGVTLRNSAAKWISWRPVSKVLYYAAAVWVFVAAVFPVSLHHERIPEVLAFRPTIVNSPVSGPVWFVRNPRDHNQIGTSGDWYFGRPVPKVVDEKRWEATQLKSPAWIITGAEFFKTCKARWCAGSRLIQAVGPSALVLYGMPAR